MRRIVNTKSNNNKHYATMKPLEKSRATKNTMIFSLSRNMESAWCSLFFNGLELLTIQTIVKYKKTQETARHDNDNFGKHKNKKS